MSQTPRGIRNFQSSIKQLAFSLQKNQQSDWEQDEFLRMSEKCISNNDYNILAEQQTNFVNILLSLMCQKDKNRVQLRAMKVLLAFLKNDNQIYKIFKPNGALLKKIDFGPDILSENKELQQASLEFCAWVMRHHKNIDYIDFSGQKLAIQRLRRYIESETWAEIDDLYLWQNNFDEFKIGNNCTFLAIIKYVDTITNNIVNNSGRRNLSQNMKIQDEMREQIQKQIEDTTSIIPKIDMLKGTRNKINQDKNIGSASVLSMEQKYTPVKPTSDHSSFDANILQRIDDIQIEFEVKYESLDNQQSNMKNSLHKLENQLSILEIKRENMETQKDTLEEQIENISFNWDSEYTPDQMRIKTGIDKDTQNKAKSSVIGGIVPLIGQSNVKNSKIKLNMDLVNSDIDSISNSQTELKKPMRSGRGSTLKSQRGSQCGSPSRQNSGEYLKKITQMKSKYGYTSPRNKGQQIKFDENPKTK